MAKSPIPPASPLQSQHPLKPQYDAIVTVPCCNELQSLPETLKSLEANDSSLLDRTLIIVNVNQRASLPRQENLATLQWLKQLDTPLQLAWLDHVTSDAYPEKFGVGLARHQACTTGLPFINDKAPIISLDADSPVSAEYLQAIFNYMAEHPDFQAGHVNFRHRLCGSESERRAIRIYEQHLHRHRQLLDHAGSPHAWYALGSTIVCNKQAYQKAGGYNVRRMAGEDFYLLQQLSKTGCRIHMIEDACVYPSGRISNRVPFGTGKAVGDIVENRFWLTYHEHCYRDLGHLLNTIEANLAETAESVLDQLPEACRSWLVNRKFVETWPKLQSNSRDDEMLRQRFHEWMDAFQTLKLIHWLSDHSYPRVKLMVTDVKE